MNEGGVGIESSFNFAKQVELEKRICDEEKMYSFSDIYSREEIKSDIDRVIWIEKGFEVRDRMREINKFGEKDGDNLEFLIDEQAEINNWFGENSFLSKTLKYDDYINHVDSVLEFDVGEEAPQRVALTIDCTSAKDNLNHKIGRNLDTMILGKRRVKYFESQVDGYKGEVSCVPVVIGIDGFHVEELMDNLKTKGYLEKNPAQIAFLKEIEMQLEMYEDILSGKIGDYSETINEISLIRKTVNGVLDDKKELMVQAKTKEYLRKDQAFNTIDTIVDIKRKNPN